MYVHRVQYTLSYYLLNFVNINTQKNHSQITKTFQPLKKDFFMNTHLIQILVRNMVGSKITLKLKYNVLLFLKDTQQAISYVYIYIIYITYQVINIFFMQKVVWPVSKCLAVLTHFVVKSEHILNNSILLTPICVTSKPKHCKLQKKKNQILYGGISNMVFGSIQRETKAYTYTYILYFFLFFSSFLRISSLTRK